MTTAPTRASLDEVLLIVFCILLLVAFFTTFF